MSNKEKIVKLIKENEQQSIAQLSDALDISLSMVHRHIKKLLAEKKLKKIGSPPQVFYILAKKKAEDHFDLPTKAKEILEKNFLFISPRGEKIQGIKGFILWCRKRGFDPLKKANEYIKINNKYSALKKNGVLSGKNKIRNTFNKNTCLDYVFYADFYAWEIFGKTKLGQLLLYAKQSQNKKMIKEVVSEVKPIIQNLLKAKGINAVAFVPPTIKRQIQFMKYLEKYLNISLPKIKITKIKTDIITPQKTLNKLQDRIENANHTMIVNPNKTYKNILLIDDAIGSGATLNQIACKLKKGGFKQYIYGFALTGSAKGFDVISEI